ncbi:aldose epimerase family protein [Furfurilactobacillus rossiae]|uniref:Maltose epimerase n=1 Tax=Furfurilactobacillus rossiae DSM 15814 TaxID=1114972 RepID=A0A0R1RJ39_9LACO|nr:aldose epimerase family protein [Furfurilactobacillus rossiae]KRL53683.1 aldose 1-epimerase [Furfurilactobacillus rossiae DSM 15814]QFR67677.1 galactose mutarotase [Furfurilactobacillus rossiae]QLE60641.1 Aldose 1-epimerase [Furfurilactobacillus rossiae]
MTQSTKALLTDFDNCRGQRVQKLSLTNSHGVTLSVLTLGATLYEINVPDAEGQPHNLVLNYPHSEDYLANPFYVCMAIGRTAGRISKGQFSINGRPVTVPTNEGHNTLHGGPHGFNTVIWDGQFDYSGKTPTIAMHHKFTSQDDGFPGDSDVTIHYALTDDNRVKISFTGQSDQFTPFNPTVHTYFNLGDQNSIEAHVLQINSTQRLVLNSEKLPTGEFEELTNTPYDFERPTPLKAAINGLQSIPERGLDDVYKVEPTRNEQVIATLTDPKTHRSVTLHSARNGLVVFTANSFTHDNMNFKRTGGYGSPYLGVALEAQALPDSMNHPQFGAVMLTPGKPQTHEITYQLSF